MALREELNKLDSDVASGQITAEEFRAQRDRLLASAGNGPPSSVALPPPGRPGYPPTPSTDRTQVVPRKAAAPSDRTQVVPRKAAAASDRTQVVPRTPPQQSAPLDSDRTQVVRPSRPPSGYSTVGAPPWARGAAAADPAAGEPTFLRPGGTLPPWTLAQQVPGQRAMGYANATDFPGTPAHRWLLPLVVIVAVAVVIGICIYLIV